MLSCDHCSKVIPPPDPSHRYCPYCGAIRVISDPIDSDNDNGCFIIHQDVIGISGQIYQYDRSGGRPAPIRPDESAPLASLDQKADLFASSGTPFPESALFYRSRPRSAPSPASQKILGGKIRNVTVRHTRMFCLMESGQIDARSTRSLDFATKWSYPKWSFGSRPPALWVSEGVLYAITDRDGARLSGVDIGLGSELRIDMPLECQKPLVLIENGEVLALKDPSNQAQPVERYRLSSLSGGILSLAFSYQAIVDGDPNPEPPRPIRLGDEFVFAASDSKIYAWRMDDSSAPRMLWSNPDSYRLLPTHAYVDRETVCFIARNFRDHGDDQLLLFKNEAGLATLVQSSRSPFHSNNETQIVFGSEGNLFVLNHEPGFPIRLYKMSLQRRGMDRPELITSLAGSIEAQLDSAQVIPWDGEPKLLVDYVIRSERNFVVCNLRSDHAIALTDCKPHAQEDVKFVWEAGWVWYVNLTSGRIRLISGNAKS